MGKNKKTKPVESGKQADKAGTKSSGKKGKRVGKPKKATPDHLQHIPFRLREIMKSKDKMNTAPLKTRKPKEATARVDADDGDIPILHFKRRTAETEKAYVRRMENETQHILFLSKNQVDRMPELDEDKQQKHGSKGKSEKKKEYDTFKLQRLQQKKLDRQEARMEKQMFVDNVPFGEVAMAPPSLSIRPKKAQVKPHKDSKKLLLNSLLGHTVTFANKPSMARQRMMEEERERVVQAYRHLKKQRQEQHEARIAGVEKLKNLQ